MTAFKKTILGKILGGVAKVIKPVAVVAGAVLGIGAISGVIKGAGAIGGTIKAATGIKAVVSKVAQSAVNLVTGTTKDEREQVKGIKEEAKDAQDKLDQVQRLINAGATRARAEQMVGITPSELGSANGLQKDAEQAEKLKQEVAAGLTTAGPGCLIITGWLLTGLTGIAFVIFLILT